MVHGRFPFEGLGFQLRVCNLYGDKGFQDDSFKVYTANARNSLGPAGSASTAQLSPKSQTQALFTELGIITDSTD